MTSAATALLQFQKPKNGLTALLKTYVPLFVPTRINQTPSSAQSGRKFRRADLRHALALVKNICAIAGEPSIIEDLRIEFEITGLTTAVLRHDDKKLYDWLADVINYQGVADSVATSYLDKHGRIAFAEVRRSLAAGRRLCPKLESYWHFETCGYRKTARTCNRPDHFSQCPLPRHDLRNGSLNQAAHSLYFFMRDVAGGDFVGWIDQQLRLADHPDSPNRAQLLRDAVIEPMKDIYGISDKVLSLGFASLLLAADPRRSRWISAGASMIVVDTLVHAWLHRTGILRSLRSEHGYGPRCYSPNGCASIIDQLSQRIDARDFNPDFPRTFPRFVQKAIWRFCAQSEINRCNGNKIDDRARCVDDGCPLYTRCDRIALDPNRI